MKKLIIGLILFLMFMSCNISQAQNSFTQALRTCSKYSQLGGAQYDNTYYNILITLNKSRKTCEYKEKIYQSTGYQLLTCNFEMGQLNRIADSMDNFLNSYKNEVAKNKIYEAKLTNNADIFENFLINQKYCHVTKSKTK